MQDVIILQTIIIIYGHRIVFFPFFLQQSNVQFNAFVSQSSRCPQCKTYKSSNGENYSKQMQFRRRNKLSDLQPKWNSLS